MDFFGTQEDVCYSIMRLFRVPKQLVSCCFVAKQVLSALVVEHQQQPGRRASGDGSNSSTGKRKRADAPPDPAAHLVAAAHATVAAELSCIAASPADGLLGGEPGTTLVCVGTHQPALELLLLVGARGAVQGGSPLEGQTAHFRPLARLPLLQPQTSLPDLWPPSSDSGSRIQAAGDGGTLSGSAWDSGAARRSPARLAGGLGEWHRRQPPRRHDRLQGLLASAVGLTGGGGGGPGAHLQLQHDIPESLLLLPCPAAAASKCQAGPRPVAPPSDDPEHRSGLARSGPSKAHRFDDVPAARCLPACAFGSCDHAPCKSAGCSRGGLQQRFPSDLEQPHLRCRRAPLLDLQSGAQVL